MKHRINRGTAVALFTDVRVEHFGFAAICFTGLFAAGCNDGNIADAPGDNPVAIITGNPDQSSPSNSLFDGSTSYASPNHVISHYDWTFDLRPSGSGSTPVPNDSLGKTVTVLVDVAGDYKLRLKVTDELGRTGETVFAFSASVSQDIHIELTWPNQYDTADLDLHMIDAGNAGTFNSSAKDCYYVNCKPGNSAHLDWGVVGDPIDDPRLDVDDIPTTASAGRPENVNIDVPVAGTYRVAVHYYQKFGSAAPDADAHIRFFLNKVVVAEADHHFTAVKETWTAADIVWTGADGTVNTVDTTVYNQQP